MQLYYYDETDPADQRAPHLTTPPLDPAFAASLGVELSHHPILNTVNTLASSRSYKNRDEITISPATLGDAYQGKLEVFFAEHLHEDEEIRYILDGSGYFDVRGDAEKWVRIAVEKGDLVVLPAGIWHRFTPDQADYIKAMRLFKDEPKWTPLNRTEEMEEIRIRKEYKETYLKSGVTA